MLDDGLSGGLKRSVVGGGLRDMDVEEKKASREVASSAPSGPSTATRFSDFMFGGC